MGSTSTYQSNTGYILRADIKKHFGWTDKLIDKYLTPKKTELNKHGTTTQFYSVGSVKGSMLGQDFREDLRAAQRMKDGAARAVQTKVLNAMDRVLNCDITLPTLSKEELYTKAVEWGAAYLKDDGIIPFIEEGELVLNALSVQYLLTLCPKQACKELNKKFIGKKDVEHFFTLLVLDQIALRYPFLKDECDERSGHNLNLLIDQAIQEVNNRRNSITTSGNT